MVKNHTDTNHCPKGERLKLSLDCWLQLIRTYDAFHAQVSTLLQAHHLTLPQFELLSTLMKADCTNQQELADRLQVTKGNMVGLIDRLAERGWVERLQVPDDRRVNRVRITEPGKTLMKKVFPEQAGVVEKMMSAMKAQELIALQELLIKLAENP